ncbi:SDR family NAD(P)-dependent oxidoreductase [Pseudonocardia sp. CA-107938]|uniref:SDR family NAD(P)-dependent oxidoreductase n=1 Tax=Pseudonocardia sp. CA-107938 TaxID=3240021 RepID=UPI003D8A3738
MDRDDPMLGAAGNLAQALGLFVVRTTAPPRPGTGNYWKGTRMISDLGSGVGRAAGMAEPQDLAAAVVAVRQAEQPFAGRRALVTGGSRGLGREIAVALAANGADVAVVSRKVGACRELAEGLSAASGRRVSAHGVHVGEWGALEGMLDEVEDAIGPVDVLVNNAGISPLFPSLYELSEELYDKVMAVNLKGPFRLTAVAGSRMVSRRGGAVLNISSIGSVRPEPAFLPYAAAKAGLNAMTVGFAQELAPSVRVNAILAGRFLTDIGKAWDVEAVEAENATTPARRAGLPSEIVGAALYLCGPAAGFTTGAVLAVDGGRLASGL